MFFFSFSACILLAGFKNYYPNNGKTISAQTVVTQVPTQSATQEVIPTQTLPPSSPTPSVYQIIDRLDGIDLRLNSAEKAVDIQANVFNATVSRMESNLNVILAILGIGSLVIAILGFSFVKVWVQNTVANQLKEITAQEIARISEIEVKRIRSEWEPKFANLYEEYQKALVKK